MTRLRRQPEPETKPASHRSCAYCVPDGSPPNESAKLSAECLIKMLGSQERRHVARELYRLGHQIGLFDKKCPMSEARVFQACPFYEDPSDIVSDDEPQP